MEPIMRDLKRTTILSLILLTGAVLAGTAWQGQRPDFTPEQEARLQLSLIHI